ncbi:MAG: hypothetical protein QOI20_3035 [Acidimicrobiaceae bacterium]|nr:hypothetical protein [Acidimicrobiaceae bacterium]
MRIAAYVPDLMDRSKVAAAAAEATAGGTAGGGIVFVASAAGLVEADAELVVVDLSRPGVLDALRALPAQVQSIGFGSHVDADLLAGARDAGCGTVLPRSQFFARLPTLLAPR